MKLTVSASLQVKDFVASIRILLIIEKLQVENSYFSGTFKRIWEDMCSCAHMYFLFFGGRWMWDGAAG